MELQKGRPADTAGRLEKEIRTYDLLDRLGVAYERVDHAPAMTMEVCQEIDQTLQAVICKNLFLCNRQETAFYLLMIPDTKAISPAVNILMKSTFRFLLRILANLSLCALTAFIKTAPFQSMQSALATISMGLRRLRWIFHRLFMLEKT